MGVEMRGRGEEERPASFVNVSVGIPDTGISIK